MRAHKTESARTRAGDGTSGHDDMSVGRALNIHLELVSLLQGRYGDVASRVIVKDVRFDTTMKVMASIIPLERICRAIDLVGDS